MLVAYRIATRVIAPALPLWLAWRKGRGKETERSIAERRGRYERARPNGPLVWMHGASLGETAGLMPIVERVLTNNSEANVLVTSQTVSSAELLAGRLPARAMHVFAPIDTPAAVTRFLDHWRPDAFVLAESELWPNLLGEVKRRNIPAALVNARMNADSLSRWHKRAGAARELLGTFEVVLAADRATQASLSEILGSEVARPGNTKLAVAPPAPEEDAVARLKAKLGDHPTVCVLSLHPEEGQVLMRWVESLPQDVRVVIAPRYPEVTDHGELDDPRVHVLQGLGTTGLACAVSDCAVVGGSVASHLKGHNPLEALHMGLPVASGPHVASFADVYADWFAHAGTEPGLEVVGEWLRDSDVLATAKARAESFATRYTRVTDAVMEALSPVLEDLK